MTSPTHIEDIVAALVEEAIKAGADAADALVAEGISHAASVRLGALENVDRSEGQDLGLRVMDGKRQASVSSSDLSRDGLKPLAERAVAMAKLAPEDPYCGLAPRERLATEFPDFDLIDSFEPSSDHLVDLAREAEDAARAVKGVTNSNGGSASWGRSGVVLATSEGFLGSYGATSYGISASVVAGEGETMERDYDYTQARHHEDLEGAAEIGARAGEKTVRKLNPQKVSSQSLSVVYDPRISSGLVGHLAGAISGSGIARGTSFLKDQMGAQLFKTGIRIIDDPHRKRGFGSKPFDGEGVANRRHELIKDGCLTTWLLDMATARQLGLETTGHASRGTGGPPSPGTTNLWMEPGGLSVDDLIADIDNGLYVTELIGQGVNGITGDYSRGAGGYWIEKGKISFPVNEVTIASNLKDMFRQMTPASDLEFKGRVNAPTIRVDGMTLAGN